MLLCSSGSRQDFRPAANYPETLDEFRYEIVHGVRQEPGNQREAGGPVVELAEMCQNSCYNLTFAPGNVFRESSQNERTFDEVF